PSGTDTLLGQKPTRLKGGRIAIGSAMRQEVHAIRLLIKGLVKGVMTNQGSANSRSGWIRFINKGSKSYVLVSPDA
ncbi:hypothetical protein AMTR_s00172p00073980, partial [Amborella trichopoda]